MRLVSILMLTLLILGFAARPSVSCALSNGSVLQGHFQLVTPETPSVGLTTPDRPVRDIAKCVSLGILPPAAAVSMPEDRLSPTYFRTAMLARAPGSDIFRPPTAAG